MNKIIFSFLFLITAICLIISIVWWRIQWLDPIFYSKSFIVIYFKFIHRKQLEARGMHLIPGFGSQRKADLYKFEACLVYSLTTKLQKKKINKWKKTACINYWYDVKWDDNVINLHIDAHMFSDIYFEKCYSFQLFVTRTLMEILKCYFLTFIFFYWSTH